MQPNKPKFISNHEDLEVYQIAFDAAMEIFELSKNFPKEEKYSLIDQIRRSSRSVCANLAEAWRRRRYKGSFLSKLNDAEAEAAENVYIDTNPLADIQEQQLASIDVAAQYSAAQNLTAFNYLTVDYMKHRDFSVQELAEEVHKSEQAVRKTFDSMMENPAEATKKILARIQRRRSSQRVMA
jgi:hypothetical protein